MEGEAGPRAARLDPLEQLGGLGVLFAVDAIVGEQQQARDVARIELERRVERLDRRLAIGIGGLAGSALGARLQPKLPEGLLRRGLGVLALGLGLRYAILGLI